MSSHQNKSNPTQQQQISYPISTECTSLQIIPAGTHVLAGFSDGTIRLYNISTGTHSCNSNSNGIILSQIRAKGVYTKLLVTVDISEDNKFAFAGALRGSVELHAIDLTQVLDTTNVTYTPTVHTHAHAKLKGFGACTRVGNNSYRLLCGRGIKSVHVWSFTQTNGGQAVDFATLYSLPVPGMSVEMLQWRYSGKFNDKLEAVTKGEGCKMRVWDMSALRCTEDSNNLSDKPTYKEIQNTEDLHALQGNFAYGGSANQSLGIVDVRRACDVYNRTEMPLSTDQTSSFSTSRRSSRGTLHSIISVCGLDDELVIQMSDGSVYHASHMQDTPVIRKLNVFEGSNTCRYHVGRVEGVVVLVGSEFEDGAGEIVVKPLSKNETLYWPEYVTLNNSNERSQTYNEDMEAFLEDEASDKEDTPDKMQKPLVKKTTTPAVRFDEKATVVVGTNKTPSPLSATSANREDVSASFSTPAAIVISADKQAKSDGQKKEGQRASLSHKTPSPSTHTGPFVTPAVQTTNKKQTKSDIDHKNDSRASTLPCKTPFQSTIATTSFVTPSPAIGTTALATCNKKEFDRSTHLSRSSLVNSGAPVVRQATIGKSTSLAEINQILGKGPGRTSGFSKSFKVPKKDQKPELTFPPSKPDDEPFEKIPENSSSDASVADDVSKIKKIDKEALDGSKIVEKDVNGPEVKPLLKTTSVGNRATFVNVKKVIKKGEQQKSVSFVDTTSRKRRKTGKSDKGSVAGVVSAFSTFEDISLDRGDRNPVAFEKRPVELESARNNYTEPVHLSTIAHITEKEVANALCQIRRSSSVSSTRRLPIKKRSSFSLLSALTPDWKSISFQSFLKRKRSSGEETIVSYSQMYKKHMKEQHLFQKNILAASSILKLEGEKKNLSMSSKEQMVNMFIDECKMKLKTLLDKQQMEIDTNNHGNLFIDDHGASPYIKASFTYKNLFDDVKRVVSL